MEVNFTARVRQGLTFQGGTSTGRPTTDNCEINAQLPEDSATARIRTATSSRRS